MEGYIYLIRLDGCLKLGFSTNVERRLKSYQTGNLKVDVIKVVPGTKYWEKEIHRNLNKGKEQYALYREAELIRILGDGLARNITTKKRK